MSWLLCPPATSQGRFTLRRRCNRGPMHTKPMAESQGVFEGDWKPSECPCPKCKVLGQNFYIIWESSCGGFEDYKHHCRACGHIWWIDGIDS